MRGGIIGQVYSVEQDYQVDVGLVMWLIRRPAPFMGPTSISTKNGDRREHGLYHCLADVHPNAGVRSLQD